MRQCGVTQISCSAKPSARVSRGTLRAALRRRQAPTRSTSRGAVRGEAVDAQPVGSRARHELRSGDLVSCTPDASPWQPGEHGGETRGSRARASSSICARGSAMKSVYGLRVLESHRPETSWATAELKALARGKPTEAVEDHVSWLCSGAPAWLLREPQPLIERMGLPQRHGASIPRRAGSGRGRHGAAGSRRARLLHRSRHPWCAVVDLP